MFNLSFDPFRILEQDIENVKIIIRFFFQLKIQIITTFTIVADFFFIKFKSNLYFFSLKEFNVIRNA